VRQAVASEKLQGKSIQLQVSRNKRKSVDAKKIGDGPEMTYVSSICLFYSNYRQTIEKGTVAFSE